MPHKNEAKQWNNDQEELNGCKKDTKKAGRGNKMCPIMTPAQGWAWTESLTKVYHRLDWTDGLWTTIQRTVHFVNRWQTNLGFGPFSQLALAQWECATKAFKYLLSSPVRTAAASMRWWWWKALLLPPRYPNSWAQQTTNCSEHWKVWRWFVVHSSWDLINLS